MVGAQALAPTVQRASPSARRSALLGNLDLFAGGLASAEQHLGEAWQAQDRSPASLAGALCEQVTVLLVQGRADEAVLWGRRAVEASGGNPSALHRAQGLLSLATLAMAQGAPGEAVKAVARVRDQWEGKWFGPVGLLDWQSLEVEALVALAEIELGLTPAEFAVAHAVGRGLTNNKRQPGVSRSGIIRWP